MRLCAIIPVSNPLKGNYFTFFACVRSWSRLVDQIIIVDGGTSDESFENIEAEDSCTIRIVSDPTCQFDIERPFSPNQINQMLNYGFLHASAFDWSFIVFADYVVSSYNKNDLINDLDKCSDHPWVKYERYKISINKDKKVEYKFDHRGAVILNNKFLKRENIKHPMGILKQTNVIYDYPIRASEYCGLILHSGARVVVPRGHPLSSTQPILNSVKVFVSDHFFYSKKQAVKQKIKFHEFFDARARGGASYKKNEANFRVARCNSGTDIETVLSAELPQDFKFIVKTYYKKDMLGTKINETPLSIVLWVFSAERKLRSLINKILGMKGVFGHVEWHEDESKVQYSDLKKIYDGQERFF